jgi:predicted AlkP superfamily phosphohydrolase/phosphomutase
LRKKVIVIGLDGLEPGIVEAMLERGELPNLAKIRATGSYTRRQTTYPANSGRISRVRDGTIGGRDFWLYQP